jgi:hypothetical protein
MSGRASIFEKPKPKVDVSGFAPRAEAEARPRPEDLEELTRGSKFRSREGTEPEPVRVHQRRRRTGRNVQFNIRATQQVIDEFKALSEEMDWPDGLTLEKALAARKREMGKS